MGARADLREGGASGDGGADGTRRRGVRCVGGDRRDDRLAGHLGERQVAGVRGQGDQPERRAAAGSVDECAASASTTRCDRLSSV